MSEQPDRIETLECAVGELSKELLGVQKALLQASHHVCDLRPTCACCGMHCSPRLAEKLAPYAGRVCLACASQPSGKALLDAARCWPIVEE